MGRDSIDVNYRLAECWHAGKSDLLKTSALTIRIFNLVVNFWNCEVLNEVNIIIIPNIDVGNWRSSFVENFPNENEQNRRVADRSKVIIQLFSTRSRRSNLHEACRSFSV